MFIYHSSYAICGAAMHQLLHFLYFIEHNLNSQKQKFFPVTPAYELTAKCLQRNMFNYNQIVH